MKTEKNWNNNISRSIIVVSEWSLKSWLGPAKIITQKLVLKEWTEGIHKYENW